MGLALGGLAALVMSGNLLWARRIELFVIPSLWRESLRLARIQSQNPDDPVLARTLPRRLNRLDWALSSLVRLQDPTFLGGRGFQLYSLRSREGELVHALRCEPLLEPFDSTDDVETISHYFCDCADGALLAVNASGRLLGKPTRHLYWYGGLPREDPYAVFQRPPGTGDVVRVAQSRHDGCPRCCLQATPALEYSIDRDGLVSHGMVTDDELGLPLCPPPPTRSAIPVDEARLTQLLASRRDGDLHRALDLLARADSELAEMAEPLLRHDDPMIRARAVGVLGSFRAQAPLARDLLSDADRRVRYAAIEALNGTADSDDILAPRARDFDPGMALRASTALLYSRDKGLARAALLSLLRARVPLALSRSHCDLASAELAECMLGWIEEQARRDSILDSLECSLRSSYTAEQLRPLVPRIGAVYALRVETDPYSSENLARALVKADCAEGDSFLVATLVGGVLGWDSQWTPVQSILEELQRRGSSLRGDLGRPLLLALVLRLPVGVATKDTEAEAESAAFLLAREGSPEALRWMIRRFGSGESPCAVPLLAAQARWWEVRAGLSDCEADAETYLPWSSAKRFR